MWNFLLTLMVGGIAVFSMLTAYDANVTSEKLGASQTISSLTSYTNPDDADSLPIVDAANAQTKRITWGNATSSLGTYFSTVYSPIFSTSAGLAGLLSDETGSGGGFVRASSSVIQSPRINVTSDATGDIYYRNSGGAFTRLGIGSTGDALSITGGVPAWSSSFVTMPYTASSTFLATTTISADSLTNRALVLNGLAYKFPTNRGASTTALVENGSGTLSFDSPMVVDIGVFSTTTADIGTITVSHGLGIIPRIIKILGACQNQAGTGSATSYGSYVPSTGEYAVLHTFSTLSGGMYPNTVTNAVINLVDTDGAPTAVQGTISSVSTTQFVVNITTNSSTGCNAGDSFYQWEAYR